MGLHQLHHKLKWTTHFPKVNIHLMMMIHWTPMKLNNLHPQEPGHRHMKASSNHIGKLVGNGSCIWDHLVGLHMVIWYVMHVRNFMLTHHGVWEQVAEVYKIRPYVTMGKSMIITPQWLDGRLFISLQLVWFLLLIYVQVVVDRFLDLHVFNVS